MCVNALIIFVNLTAVIKTKGSCNYESPCSTVGKFSPCNKSVRTISLQQSSVILSMVQLLWNRLMEAGHFRPSSLVVVH